MKRLVPRLDQWPWIWAGITMLLVGTVVALTVALHASSQSAQTADCVNSILAARAPLTDADHANERKKIKDQIRAEQDKYKGLTELANAKNNRARALAGFREYQHGVEEFVQALNGWKTRDDRIAALKAKHPLGRC